MRDVRQLSVPHRCISKSQSAGKLDCLSLRQRALLRSTVIQGIRDQTLTASVGDLVATCPRKREKIPGAYISVRPTACGFHGAVRFSQFHAPTAQLEECPPGTRQTPGPGRPFTSIIASGCWNRKPARWPRLAVYGKVLLRASGTTRLVPGAVECRGTPLNLHVATHASLQ